jgi:alkanesulfonate monooxygenase SsuD/methylene tetrahydromethanopterin reductase-like flavin-dependent oxidoreductase (luciferase family)
MRAYRESFEPLEDFERPSAILAVSVVCAETNEHAKKLAPLWNWPGFAYEAGAPDR